jgi:hypothetical protein
VSLPEIVCCASGSTHIRGLDRCWVVVQRRQRPQSLSLLRYRRALPWGALVDSSRTRRNRRWWGRCCRQFREARRELLKPGPCSAGAF